MDSVKMSPAQYWEWRTTIAERDVANEQFKSKQLEYKLLMKESEILKMQSQILFLSQVKVSEGKAREAHAEYDRYKQVLEKDLGVSLDKKMIHETTYEVLDLPDTAKGEN